MCTGNGRPHPRGPLRQGLSSGLRVDRSRGPKRFAGGEPVALRVEVVAAEPGSSGAGIVTVTVGRAPR